MNKKLVAMTTSLVVGGTLLLGTAYANASQLSGYEAFKSSIMATKDLKNGTANISVSVKDGSSDLMDVSSNVKINIDANAMSEVTSIKTAKGTDSFSMYRQDGKMISKTSNSDVYTVRQDNRKNFDIKKKTDNPEIQKSMETVVDTLVGSMKDDVSVVNNDDGTKKVTVALADNQITPLVNAITSMAVVGSTNEPMHNEKAGKVDLRSILPQLVSDVSVKSVNIDGDINKDNTIKDQKATIVVDGKDAQGTTHEITINVNLDLSNINGTTPDKVDLTGKQVQNITSKFRGRD